jgi:hypothetical protein
MIVLFFLAGVPLVYLGVARDLAWIRMWRWRVLHFGAIAFVAAKLLQAREVAAKQKN